MAKRHNNYEEFTKLLEQADVLLKKRKLPPKKKCTICSVNDRAVGKLCAECYRTKGTHKAASRVGKTWISTNGLEFIYNDEGKPQLHHRYVMEQKLGRKLDRAEKVSWLNGDKLDNRPENLTLLSDPGTIICPHCNTPYYNDSKNSLA